MTLILVEKWLVFFHQVVNPVLVYSLQKDGMNGFHLELLCILCHMGLDSQSRVGTNVMESISKYLVYKWGVLFSSCGGRHTPESDYFEPMRC